MKNGDSHYNSQIQKDCEAQFLSLENSGIMVTVPIFHLCYSMCLFFWELSIRGVSYERYRVGGRTGNKAVSLN
jgi:hypothetical protein